MQIQIKTLKNGMRLAVDVMPSVETLFVGLWAGVGSRDEPRELAGISHFLEHMAFKGTAKRTCMQIAETIEDIGGEMNAYTSKDHTLYYTKSLKEHLSTCVELLADIVQNSIFDADETQKEQRVIMQELLSAQDDPEDLVYELFGKTAYGDSPLGRPIIGFRETVEAISRDKLKAWISERYSADRLLLLVAGNVSADEAERLAERHFDHITPAKPAAFTPAKYIGGSKTENKKLEQTHYILGFPSSPVVEREKALAESLMCSVLGGSPASRLFQEVRERRNLVYSIYSSFHTYVDAAVMNIHSSSEPGLIKEVRAAIDGEVEKMLLGVTDKELARAKEGLKTSLLMAQESPSLRARRMGRAIQYFGRIVPPEEDISILSALSSADIKAAAERVFAGRRTCVLLGDGV